MSFRVQYSNANDAPFQNGVENWAAKTQDALTRISLGLEVEGAGYPILRVFASWPGGAGRNCTGVYKEEEEETAVPMSINIR